MPTARKRRTAEGARDEILAAAERRLATTGPAGLRLQDIAADVGISHPAILHHFGNRDALVEAVVDRAIRNLLADLVKAFQQGGGVPGGAQLFDRVYESFAERGHARLLAWLLLSGYDPLRRPELRDGWRGVIAATHTVRTSGRKGGAYPTVEDTSFTVVLSCLALFGQALAGSWVFDLAGLGRGAEVDRRFRRWLARLLETHLAAPVVPPRRRTRR